MIKLRSYQEQAVEAVLHEWETRNSTLVVAACGAGKTETGLAILARALGDGRAIWLAHRRELIYQPRDRVLANWQELGRPGVVMADEDECAAQVIVATVQTLKANGRLERILAHGLITHLVIDEGHHSTSESYKTVTERLRESNPGLKVLGLTATPKRTDERGLAEVFESVAYRITIKDLVRQGYLVPMKAFGISLPVSFQGLKEDADGWNDEEAGEILSLRNAEEMVIKTWETHAKERLTVAFCASVHQAHSLARHFRDEGYAFEAIDGTTPKPEREAVLKRLSSGEIRGVANCAVLTEGWDSPVVSCLLQVKPTKSDLNYIQMVGRVLRTSPGKTDALILDFVPQDARDMVMAGDVLGKPKEQRKAEEKARSDGIIGAFGIDSEGEGIDGDPDKVLLTVLDYFSTSRLCWYYQGVLATAAIGDKDTLVVRMPDPEQAARLAKADDLRASGKWSKAWDGEYERVRFGGSFQLWHLTQEEKKTVPAIVGLYMSWEEATYAAGDLTESLGLSVLSKRDAKWRAQPASDKQKALLTKLKLWEHLPKQDRGTAAKALTHFFAERALSGVKLW